MVFLFLINNMKEKEGILGLINGDAIGYNKIKGGALL